MQRFWRLLGLFLFALLAGCGQPAGPSGNDGGNNHGISAQRVAAALQAAEVQLYKVASPLKQAGVPVPLVLLPFSVGVAPLDTASWDCSSVTVTGNLADVDDDGIPVHATFDGRCSWSYSGPGGAVSGWWEYKDLSVQDPNDHDPTAGIKASGKVYWSYTVEGGTVTVAWTLTQHDLIKRDDHYDFVYKGKWTITTDRTYTLEYDLSGTWTPDDPNKPWDDGTLAANGRFTGSGPDCGSTWELTVEVSNLHYADCGVDRGSVTYSGHDCDGNRCTVTVTWSGCGTPSVSGSCQ